MSKKFHYKKKNSHDLKCDHGLIRIWDVSGDFDKTQLIKLFLPLFKTGFVYPYISLMPDHHPGKDAMVGSVIPAKEVLMPTLIGGDIGCGVASVQLPIKLSDLSPYLNIIYKQLKEAIPTGSSYNSTVTERVQNQPVWQRSLHANLSNRDYRKLKRQFASLGGGNHFLELQTDLDDNIWIMLHSGSRYLGVIIRDYYTDAGRLQEGIDANIYRRVPYLIAGTALAENYLSDVLFAVEFAKASRHEMMLRTLEVIATAAPAGSKLDIESLTSKITDVSHNYVAKEKHFDEELYIHRKGAIRANKDERVLIPGSMGTSSFIASGRGNQFAFCSCSHGAGRNFSRTEAIKKISNKEFKRSVSNVYHEWDSRLKDEAPAAYKDINTVMRGQKDLVKIVTELHPMLSIKDV